MSAPQNIQVMHLHRNSLSQLDDFPQERLRYCNGGYAVSNSHKESITNLLELSNCKSNDCIPNTKLNDQTSIRRRPMPTLKKQPGNIQTSVTMGVPPPVPLRTPPAVPKRKYISSQPLVKQSSTPSQTYNQQTQLPSVQQRRMSLNNEPRENQDWLQLSNIGPSPKHSLPAQSTAYPLLPIVMSTPVSSTTPLSIGRVTPLSSSTGRTNSISAASPDSGISTPVSSSASVRTIQAVRSQMSIESSKHLQNSSVLSSEASRISCQSPLSQKANNQSAVLFNKIQSGTLGSTNFISQNGELPSKKNCSDGITSNTPTRSSLRSKKSLPQTNASNYTDKLKSLKSKLPPPPLDPPPAIPISSLNQLFKNDNSSDISKNISATSSVAALAARTISNVLAKSSQNTPLSNILPPMLSKCSHNQNPPLTNTTVVSKNSQIHTTNPSQIIVKSSNHSNIPPPLPSTTSTSPGSNKMSIRQDSGISSDSFSQTSSPSYTSKTMETPLLPYSTSVTNQAKIIQGKMGNGANRQKSISKKSSETFDLDRDGKNGAALTKSVSTPASLQTIVRFHNGSNMSLHHKIIRDIRRPSKHYVGHLRLRFRLAQVLVNAIALLAIGGGLAAYFKAYPTAVQNSTSNVTTMSLVTPVGLGENPAPGICLPVIVNFCLHHKIPYNYTVFPNYMGHFGQREAQQELEIYDSVVDVRCYELAALFLCSVFVPKCGPEGSVVRPCRKLCRETKDRCGFFLDVFGLALPEYLDCSLFPESPDPEVCVGHHEVEEVERREKAPVCTNGFKCDEEIHIYPNEHKITKLRCIPKDWQCDGHLDCQDQSDELNCKGCPNGTIYCGDVKHTMSCITQKHLCDGHPDCPFAQDEKNCLRLSERNGDIGKGQLQIFYVKENNSSNSSKNDVNEDKTGDRNNRTILWKPACVLNNWDPNVFSNTICNMLGYGTVAKSRVYNMHYDNITPPSQKYNENHTLLQQLKSCEGKYPTVNLTCTKYMCGKIRNIYTKPSLRIIGGATSKPGDWPFLVALLGGPKQIFYCAGVLIADQWVLTASHCVGNHSDVNGWTIQLGVTRRHSHAQYGQKMGIQRVIPHPLYNLGVPHDNDVALFQLKKPVVFSDHLLPVCLPPADKELLPGTMCTVIGWGKREDREMSEYEPAVNEVEVPVLNRDLCNTWLENKELNVTEGMICAGYKEGGKDACQGDSGGPLLCRSDTDADRWFVGGIVSWGIKCAHPHLPGVYAYVPRYIPWIKQQMAMYSDRVNERNFVDLEL